MLPAWPQPLQASEPSRWQKVVAKIAALFRFGKPKTISPLRGQDAAYPGDVYLLNLATRQQTRLTEDDGHRTPIFTPDGRQLVTLRNRALVFLEAGSGRLLRTTPLKGSAQSARWLIGWSEEGLGIVTDAGKVLLLREDGSSSRTVQAKLPPEGVHELLRLARQCRGMDVQAQPSQHGAERTLERQDVVLTPESGSSGAPDNVTASFRTRTHADPAFSPGCDQIAYVAR